MRIHPLANAVDCVPNFLSHGDPAADGGATINAPFQSVPFGIEAAYVVAGSAMPLAR
jgi:hypothetical protein